MAYTIQLERRAVKDIEELKKSGNKATIEKIKNYSLNWQNTLLQEQDKWKPWKAIYPDFGVEE